MLQFSKLPKIEVKQQHQLQESEKTDVIKNIKSKKIPKLLDNLIY